VRWRFFEASGRRGECYAFAFDPPLRDRDTFDETNADPTSSYTCGPLPDVLDHSFPVFVAAGGRSDTGHYAVLAGVVADAVTKVEIVWKDGVHTSVPIEDPNYFVHIWRDDRVPDRVEVGTDHGRTVSCARQTNTLYSCDP
jgi:hypothetical protein